MNIITILKHGHQVIVDATAELPEPLWTMQGACGAWNVKDVIGHLASVEQVQMEVLNSNMGQKIEKIHLEQIGSLGLMGFNARQTQLRQEKPYQETWNEYVAAFNQLLKLMEKVPDSLLHQPGLGAFYVEGYSLADFFVHGIYGHKREHAAQIVCFLEANTASQTA